MSAKKQAGLARFDFNGPRALLNWNVQNNDYQTAATPLE